MWKKIDIFPAENFRLAGWQKNQFIIGTCTDRGEVNSCLLEKGANTEKRNRFVGIRRNWFRFGEKLFSLIWAGNGNLQGHTIYHIKIVVRMYNTGEFYEADTIDCFNRMNNLIISLAIHWPIPSNGILVSASVRNPYPILPYIHNYFVSTSMC